MTGQHLPGTPKDIHDAQEALTHLYLILTRLHRLRRFAQRPRPASKSTTLLAVRKSPAEAAAGRLSARETIDRANTQHDLGDLLTSYGASLVATRGGARYYDGLGGDVHDHPTTYIVSPARDGSGHIGHSYSPNGRLNNTDFPRGFRWFDVFAALEHSGDLVAALKALSPQPVRAAPPIPPHPTATPEYVTIEEAEQRRQWRDTKQRQRAEVQRERRERTERLSALASTDVRLGQRERDAWAIHCIFFASQSRHCVSVAAQAARLCAVERAEESHVRRMQRANERLIACGYLKRSDRRDGSNVQTSWWEPGEVDAHRVTQADLSTSDAVNVVSAPTLDAHRVTPPQDEDRVTLDRVPVTLREQDMCSTEYTRACEWGAGSNPHACNSSPLLEATSDQATFDPTVVHIHHGPYTGRTKHSLSLDELVEASNEHWRQMRETQAAVVTAQEELEPCLLDLPSHRPEPDVSALDRYHARIALMDEVRLAGELRKHQATLRKHAGAYWLAQVRQKVRYVEHELDVRDAARPAARPAPHSHAPALSWLQAELSADP